MSFKNKLIKLPYYRTNLIVAIDSTFGISKNNIIPWKIKEDMNFFQDVTRRTYVPDEQNVVIMGKSTWKALPDSYRGLRDRINIVVSSSMTTNELNTDNKTKTESYLVKSLSDAFGLCDTLQPGKVFIGGGSQIYKDVLENYSIDEIYITHINKNYECDNLFPIDAYNKVINNYKIHSSHEFKVNDENSKENSKENITVKFTKFYRDQLPSQFNQNPEESQYVNLMDQIIRTGDFRKTRNANTWSVFGKTLEYDLANGFPILTTKRVFFRGIFEELMFFLKGDTNTKILSDKNVKIWEPNTTREFLDSVGLQKYEQYDMGPMYGYQWRHFNVPYEGMNADYANKGFDQINYCLNLLKTDPYSRRIIMTTFNPAQAKEGCLYPCHSIVLQWYVEKNNRLSLNCYNRSQDYICGNPFNMSMAALLIHLFCEVLNNDHTTKFLPGRLIMNLGDTHIYEDHYSEGIRQILRDPYEFPQLIFKRKVKDIGDFTYDDVVLANYVSYPNLNVKMVA